mgnify:FL=1
MSDMRKKYDAPLYNVKDSKRKYEPYTRSCGTSDMRQPMIINKLEYEAFKHKIKS